MSQELEDESIKDFNFDGDYFGHEPNDANNNLSTGTHVPNGTNGTNDNFAGEQPKNQDENVNYIHLNEVNELPKQEDKKMIATKNKENEALNENKTLMDEEQNEKEKEEKKEIKKAKKVKKDKKTKIVKIVKKLNISKKRKKNKNNGKHKKNISKKKKSSKPLSKPIFKVDKIQTPIQRDLAERNNNINIPSSNINASSNQDPQFVSSNINPNIDIPRQSFELFINRPMENENEDEELNQEHLQNLEFNQPIWMPPDNMVIEEEDNDGLDGNNNGFNDFNNYFGNEDQITEGKTQTNNDLIQEQDISSFNYFDGRVA